MEGISLALFNTFTGRLQVKAQSWGLPAADFQFFSVGWWLLLLSRTLTSDWGSNSVWLWAKWSPKAQDVTLALQISLNPLSLEFFYRKRKHMTLLWLRDFLKGSQDIKIFTLCVTRNKTAFSKCLSVHWPLVEERKSNSVTIITVKNNHHLVHFLQITWEGYELTYKWL
jgi:hypothetical protein